MKHNPPYMYIKNGKYLFAGPLCITNLVGSGTPMKSKAIWCTEAISILNLNFITFPRFLNSVCLYCASFTSLHHSQVSPSWFQCKLSKLRSLQNALYGLRSGKLQEWQVLKSWHIPLPLIYLCVPIKLNTQQYMQFKKLYNYRTKKDNSRRSVKVNISQ